MLSGELMGVNALSGDIQRDVISVGGSGGTTNYNSLSNKPKINGVELSGNKTTEDLGIEIPEVDLSGKLDKDTNESSTMQVYGKNIDGSQTMLNAVQYYYEDRNGIARYINGNIIVNAPTQDAHATTKKYVDDKFNGANKAVSFVNYSSMISSLNTLSNTSYNVGQNIMIVTLAVPDLWISEIAEESVAYAYVSDDDFVSELTTNGSVQVGYYKLSALETQKVDLTDYVEKPAKSVVQQIVTVKPNDSGIEGIGVASASSDAIFGRIPRYQNPTYDNADTPPQNMGNLVVADPTKPLHVANKRWAEDKFVAQQTPEFDTGATRGFVYTIEQQKNAETGEYEQVQTVKKLQIQANYDTIPLRNPSGNFYVGDPTLPYECANVKTITALTGTTAPKESTKALFFGQEYLDTTNNTIYKCIAIDTTNKTYTWVKLIKETDYAVDNGQAGIVKTMGTTYGVRTGANGLLFIDSASQGQILDKGTAYKPITPNNLDYAIVVGLTTNSITLTDEQKTAIKNWLGL